MGDGDGKLPRRVPGKAMRDLLRDSGDEPTVQDARDHLTRIRAAERLRRPRWGWRTGERRRNT